MSKVRVEYTGMTSLRSYLKQGSIDPGNSSDLWLLREMDFKNTDSLYTLSWQDSEFQAKSCFVFSQADPHFVLSNDCGDQTLIRGIYHNSAKSISSLVCLFKKYNPGADQNSFLAQNATLAVPFIDLESIGDDSVSFTVKNWAIGSLSLGYSYDEQAYGTYFRQMQLSGYDTLGMQYPEVCRVVFYTK